MHCNRIKPRLNGTTSRGCICFCIFILVLCLHETPCHALGFHNWRDIYAAHWQGRIWIPDATWRYRIGSGPETEINLMSCDYRGKCRRESRIRDSGISMLLPAGDRLWLISEQAVGWYDARGYHGLPKAAPLDNITYPFLYQNAPAVIQKVEQTFHIWRLEKGRWVKKHSFSLNLGNLQVYTKFLIQALWVDSELHLFVSLRDGTHYHQGLPGAQGAVDPAQWQKITDCKYMWRAAAVSGKPALFCLKGTELGVVTSQISGLAIEGGKPREIYYGRSMNIGPSPLAMNILPVNDRSYVLVSETATGRFRTQLVRDGRTVASAAVGPVSVLYMLMYFLPAALAIFVLAYVLNALLALVNPLCMYTWGMQNFREERVVANPRVRTADIMAGPLKKMPSYVVKIRPRANAVTLRIGLFVGPKTDEAMIINGVFFFKDTDRGVRVTFISKWEFAQYMFLLIVPVLLSPLYAVMTHIFSMAIAGIVTMVPVAAAMAFMVSRKDAHYEKQRLKCQRFFDMFLYVAGLTGEHPDAAESAGVPVQGEMGTRIYKFSLLEAFTNLYLCGCMLVMTVFCIKEVLQANGDTGKIALYVLFSGAFLSLSVAFCYILRWRLSVKVLISDQQIIFSNFKKHTEIRFDDVESIRAGRSRSGPWIAVEDRYRNEIIVSSIDISHFYKLCKDLKQWKKRKGWLDTQL